MVELRLIRYATTLADLKNFARAAEVLGITQPSLSRSIATLEDQLGVQLFERRHDGATPTPFGRVFIERGALILAGAHSLEDEIGQLAGRDTARLAIGLGAYAADISAGPAMVRLLREMPGLAVDVLVDDPDAIVAGLLSRRFDVGIAVVRPADVNASLQVEILPTHPLYVAVRPGHPLLARSTLTLADILEFPVASSLVTSDLAALIAPVGGAGFVSAETGHLRPPIHVNNLALARRIVLESNAVLAGTTSMLRDDLVAGRLVRLDFQFDAMRTVYSILWNRDRPRSAAATRFIEIIGQVEREVAEHEATDQLRSRNGC